MLCKPANLILLISIGGVVYHLLSGDYQVLMWWALVGVFGVATFQGLCMGNFESIAWILMSIPVLLVCFFMAIALVASSIRVRNVNKNDDGPCNKPMPRCNRSRCSNSDIPNCCGSRQECNPESWHNTY